MHFTVEIPNASLSIATGLVGIALPGTGAGWEPYRPRMGGLYRKELRTIDFKAKYPKSFGITSEQIFDVHQSRASRSEFTANLLTGIDLPKRVGATCRSTTTLTRGCGWANSSSELHIGFESAEPFPLRTPERGLETGQDDPCTLLSGNKASLPHRPGRRDRTHRRPVRGLALPPRPGGPCWSRSSHQYKERKPRDPSIAAKFNTYRFADHKERVIDLLRRVCTVSVETMDDRRRHGVLD